MGLERGVMSDLAFTSAFSGNALRVASVRHILPDISPQQHPNQRVFMGEPKKKSFFGKLKEQIWRPIVTVPGGGNKGDLLKCVFCSGTGSCDCDACRGTGKDSLGVCLMCDGKTFLTCTVCNGVGVVDRVRRGGTDDRNKFTKKEKI